MSSSFNYHFSKYIDSTHIATVKNQKGFQDGLTIEKFIMDFEMLYHIQQKLSNCIVKGGMAVPFHISDHAIRRLSTDIDIMTSMSKSEVISVIQELGIEVKNLITIPDPYTPNEPKKILNLLNYYPEYASCLGGNQKIQIDITYDFNEKILTKEINGHVDLDILRIDYNMEIYEIGSLIGDKITTLGFNTIGIDSDRHGDIPKQIYDIGTLAKIVNNQTVFENIVETYETVSNYENSFTSGTKFTEQQIIDDTLDSLNSLLITKNGYSLNAAHKGRYTTFYYQLLGKNTKYDLNDHISDILLIILLVKNLKNVIVSKNMSKQEFAKVCYNAIQQLNQILSKSASDAHKIHTTITKKYETTPQVKLIKTLLPEQAFLYDEINTS